MLKMPLIGLGTWKLYEEECEKTVKTALELGYRHIDTADEYQNHEAIGKAIKSWPRKELFLTTKVAVHELLPNQVNAAVPRFLKELQTDYIDLLLIHWPNPDVNLIETIKAMIPFLEQGLVKSIGVSNFVRSHLEMLAPYQFPIFTNQIEVHPYLQRRSLVAMCKKMGITVTAYRPLAKGAFESDPILQKIGKVHEKSASQVALRWLIQQDIAAIPKAASIKHLKDNLDIFDFTLSTSEMLEIEKLDQGKRFCAPAGMPIFED